MIRKVERLVFGVRVLARSERPSERRRPFRSATPTGRLTTPRIGGADRSSALARSGIAVACNEIPGHRNEAGSIKAQTFGRQKRARSC